MSAIFEPDNGRPQVFSHGGGTQGSAICALIVQGRLPKPDVCVIADTGREATQVWKFWDEVTKPALEAVGIPCYRVSHDWATIDLFTGANKDTIAMPMFTQDNAGNIGMLPKYCSNEWKRRPIERFLKRNLGYRLADMWIGFSTDEATTRAKFKPNDTFRDVYPLIELGLSRQQSIEIVEQMEWGKPPRSACWMCPYRSKSEWLDLRDNWPKDFEAAVSLERQLQRHDPNVYFHRSCVPLEKVDWSAARGETYEPGCQSGLCFT